MYQTENKLNSMPNLKQNNKSTVNWSNLLTFPAFVLQIGSENIDALIQKLSENETHNTVSKLKYLLFFYSMWYT